MHGQRRQLCRRRPHRGQGQWQAPPPVRRRPLPRARHWLPHVDREGTPEAVIQQLDAELEAKGLPVAYYQLDAYWYSLKIKPAYCIENWTAVSDKFPHGLQTGGRTSAPTQS